MGCCCTVESTPSLVSKDMVPSHSDEISRTIDSMITDLEQDQNNFAAWHYKVLNTLNDRHNFH